MTSTSAPLDFSSLYTLTDPISNRSLRITVRGKSEWVSSDDAWAFYRGKEQPRETVILRGYMGGQLADFLWSDLVHLVCISNRAVEILNSNGITGWGTYPVEVYGRKGEPLPGYHGFAVTGGDCRRDRSRSQVIWKQAVPGGEPFEVYKGLYFCEEDWDGSDIFYVNGFGGTVATEKVFTCFRKAKVSNVQMIPLVEVERQVYLDKFDHDLEKH